ncbi:MAG: DUF502 domain-containing protein [Planctomycetes bacterium]|nr:DUF502 domain-containing protein [Planctomycetota bacterium]
MRRAFRWIWKRGLLANFLAGLFVLLPVMITVGILAWAGEKTKWLLGRESAVGKFLQDVFGHIVDSDTLALAIGYAAILAAIWMIGVLFKSLAKQGLDDAFHGLVGRIPIVSTIYKPIAQVVNLLKGDGSKDLSGLPVVFCSFGGAPQAGLAPGIQFLGLLASPETYQLEGAACQLVYVPTAPVPMSGGLLFVPKERIRFVPEMSVDDLMKVYLSLGVLTPQVMAARFKVPAEGKG